MRRAWGNNSDRVLAYLRENGPSTSWQIQKDLEIPRNVASQAIKRLRMVMQRGEFAGQRRVHIHGWTREQEGAKNHLRAIYAVGDGKDARSPGAKCILLANRQWRARRKERLERFGPGAALQAVWGAS